MKWVPVSRLQYLIQEFHLLDNDDCKAILKYNPVHRSARMSYENNHRLFFIESAGVLTGKYIFRNEYDMEIGNMNFGRSFGSDGTIAIESIKYHFQISSEAEADMVIADAASGLTLAKCTLPATTSASQQKSNIDSNYLLLGLCWYLSLAIAKENKVEFLLRASA